jgi:hypothetical protein
MNMKRNDISRNCFFETIPWMIVLIILFIIDVIIGIIDWFPASLLIVLIWESLYMKYRQDAIIRIIEKERKDGDIEGIR